MSLNNNIISKGLNEQLRDLQALFKVSCEMERSLLIFPG